MLYAHTPNDAGDWHELGDHLRDVSARAGTFAEVFGYKDLARLIGLWHDLGKANPAFQQYLLDCNSAREGHRRPPRSATPHAIWGAAYAYFVLKQLGVQRWPDVVLPILGHHSRLIEPSAEGAQRIGDFRERQPDALELAATFDRALRKTLATPVRPVQLPSLSQENRDLLIRMLFSALIDADRLDTEAHFRPYRSQLRATRRPTLAELDTALTKHIATFSDGNSVLGRVRREVYNACISSAQTSTGVFRLTVPTGGGKTLSGLAFALRHALYGQNDLRQVIVALPYTSIIEQNAKVYREIPGFGDDAVLEHHSMADNDSPPNESQMESGLRIQFAAENWDIPITVTTTVQLFESLFSNRPSKVRKLHNLARSVIILDEFQTFPSDFLLPTLDALRQLATPVSEGGFGCTVVFCTATQPAFASQPLDELIANDGYREIVPNYMEHFKRLRRVDYQWENNPRTWSSIAGEISTHDRAMVIVNTRMDAINLLDAFEDAPPWRYHLSTLLCPAHRRQVLGEIAKRLNTNEPVQLVATQVVECGVDLDFPVVYRAVGPLDRIVQAAGRCNRNFKMDTGRVVVFNPVEGASPRGPYQVGIGLSSLLMRYCNADELHNPQLYQEYFQRLYQEVNLDKSNIQGFRKALDFPEVADRYRLIGPTVPIVVKYGNTWRRCLSAWTERPSRETWRALQPFIVNIYEWQFKTNEFYCESVGDNLYLWSGGYDDVTHRGIKQPLSDPSDLIV